MGDGLVFDELMYGYLSEGVIEDAIAISDTMLTGTCSIFPYTYTAVNPRMTNRGGVAEKYDPPYTEVPCKLDVDVKGLIPGREKDGIEVEKSIRFLYIPLSWITGNHYLPKEQDEVETAEGNPLGVVSRYKILNVNTETDQFDVVLLLEKL